MFLPPRENSIWCVESTFVSLQKVGNHNSRICKAKFFSPPIASILLSYLSLWNECGNLNPYNLLHHELDYFWTKCRNLCPQKHFQFFHPLIQTLIMFHLPRPPILIWHKLPFPLYIITLSVWIVCASRCNPKSLHVQLFLLVPHSSFVVAYRTIGEQLCIWQYQVMSS